MREIGGEFWDVPILPKENGLFTESTQWFLSGRSALQAIVKELSWAKSIAMPSWCCDSMVKPFADAGMEVHFYPIYPQDGLIQEIKPDCDVLFLLDYFGYPSRVINVHPCIIRDVTHSIFSATYNDAEYYFGSLRKWCGVWTGGYAWRRDGHQLTMEHDDDEGYIVLRKKAMNLKNDYIHGCSDKKGNTAEGKDYLHIFEDAEDLLKNCGIAPAANRDVALAHRINVHFIRDRRRKNAKILMKAFPDQLIFPELRDEDCPMFVPILVPDGTRNELQRYLIEHDVYCPVHWPPSEYHKLDERTEMIYKNELSLICDQRYSYVDMEWQAALIKGFYKR